MITQHDFRTDSNTGESWYCPSRTTTPEEDLKTNRIILSHTIKEIDEEENPYIWMASYCMYKNHRDLHLLDRPLELWIGNRFKIWINGKSNMNLGIPPLGMEVYNGMDRAGWMQLDEYDMSRSDLEQLKQAIIDDLLEDFHKLNNNAPE